MKRITCFITSLSSGGAEHQITLLSGFLAERGYDVTLTTFGHTEDHYLVDWRVKRYCIKHNGHSLSKLKAIYYYFLTLKTDCVICFGARESFFCLVPLLLRKKIKVLAGERCATYDKLTWYKKLNYYWLYKRANFIVPNSHTQLNDITKHWPQYANKTKVITNYTDVKEYQATPLPHNRPIRIGIFCRYAEQKNYKRMASVVKKLREKSEGFEIHWYGNKYREKQLLTEYQELHSLVQQYQLEDCFILHDHTKKVAEMLKDFDALCLPSLTEGFSNSISEYVCCGRPVLCSDVADNSIMVHNDENGYLFDPENEDNMVKAFLKFFSLSDTERDAMGRKSRLIAENLFDKEKFVGSYIQLIESK